VKLGTVPRYLPVRAEKSNMDVLGKREIKHFENQGCRSGREKKREKNGPGKGQ